MCTLLKVHNICIAKTQFLHCENCVKLQALSAKDAALLQALSAKDAALLEERFKSQVNSMEQDYKLKAMQTELSFVTEKFLRAEGAMTARGIFEHMFEIFHISAGLKGKSNVAAAIRHAEMLQEGEFLSYILVLSIAQYYTLLCLPLLDLAKYPEKRTTLHPRVARVLDILQEAQFPASLLGVLNQRLSKNIHGRPWHGALVKVVMSDFDESQQRLLKAIAAEGGLTVEVVKAPLDTIITKYN